MIDPAYVFPRFSIASAVARSRANEGWLRPHERERFLELAGYLDRASETPRDKLIELYDELNSTDVVPGSPARAMAADFIDRVMDELAGVVHVPN
ncbi:hypothetical protein [Devosia sp.]|uniref:hypothetical protein n=1 Tax=Devosia sp. TaxID=1871048 RepID=UPI002FC82F55